MRGVRRGMEEYPQPGRVKMRARRMGRGSRSGGGIDGRCGRPHNSRTGRPARRRTSGRSARVRGKPHARPLRRHASRSSPLARRDATESVRTSRSLGLASACASEANWSGVARGLPCGGRSPLGSWHRTLGVKRTRPVVGPALLRVESSRLLPRGTDGRARNGARGGQA